MFCYLFVLMVIGFISIFINSVFCFAQNESDKKLYYIAVSLVACAWPILYPALKFFVIVFIINFILLVLDGYFNPIIKEWFCKSKEDYEDEKDCDDDDECLNFVEKDVK